MKRKSDPRHLKRIKIVQALFTWTFQQKAKTSQYISPIISHLSKIDKSIAKSAPDRPIEQINRVDLSILRLAVYELVVEKITPPKVVVDEAVELGKEFGAESTSSFVNGALGKLIKDQGIKT